MDRKLILIIDQDESTCKLIEGKLNGHFQVLCVPHGKRAFELIKTHSVDIAIVARCLPYMDGLEVLRLIKKHDSTLPVICIATSPSDEFIISAFRAGASDFFKKPINADQVVASVKSILDVKNALPHSQTNNVGATSKGDLISAKNKQTRSNGKTWLAPFGKILKEFVTKNSNENQEELIGNGKANTVKSDEYSENSVDTPSLRINFLGNFHILCNEQIIDTWPSRKGKSIFAYLAFNHKRRIYRDKLMDKFWPSSCPDSARNSLNVALHGLRQMFHNLDSTHEFITFQNECYFLNPELELSLDVEEFQQYWRLAQSIEREKGLEAALGEYELAAALYKGDFMEEDIYENWNSLDRENLKEIYLVVLDRLSKYYSSDSKPLTAIKLCEVILQKDNCREDVHQRLMRCYYRLGLRDKAIKQFRKCKEILNAELEVEPTQTTMDLYQKIKKDSLNLNKMQKNSHLSEN